MRLDRFLTAVQKQGVHLIEMPLEPGDGAARTGVAIARKKRQTPHSPALQVQ